MPVETAGAGVLTAIGLLLLVGAAGKSAQIPLYVWLPDAMEGPTPVSALIHAATMVTAGVYMVARSHVIFDHAPMALTVVAVIGALTALFAATIGIVQTDIKRVLAYSTVSQLGYMFMACGVAAYSARHLPPDDPRFLQGAALPRRGLGDSRARRRAGHAQDGRPAQTIPWTFWTMTAATFAIAGVPRFCGLLHQGRNSLAGISPARTAGSFWLIGVITAFLTSFYMFRLWFMTFFGEYRGKHRSMHHGTSPDTTSITDTAASTRVRG